MRTFGIFGLAVAFLIGSSISVHAGIRVVSDIDDTAKITNVGDPLGAVVNGLFSRKAFTGMQELYRSLATERGYGFEYVSGTVELLRFRVEKFLRAGKFPDGGVHLKPTIGGGTLREYKTRVLRGLIDKYSGDKFILIGDDTQVDFEVYDEIFRRAPDRILAIYIRRVRNQRLPASAYPFMTAFDIARTEFVMDRLSPSQAGPVALAILGERRDKRIVPGFAYCPVSLFGLGDPQMDQWNRAIDLRVRRICRARGDAE